MRKGCSAVCLYVYTKCVIESCSARPVTFVLVQHHHVVYIIVIMIIIKTDGRSGHSRDEGSGAHARRVLLYVEGTVASTGGKAATRPRLLLSYVCSSDLANNADPSNVVVQEVKNIIRCSFRIYYIVSN